MCSKLPGVVDTQVGYTGGKSSNPTYESVCGGDGHTEAVRVTFDPEKLTYKDVIDKVFDSHNPTLKKGKTQYKNAVWYLNDEQKKVVEEKVKDIEKDGSKVNTDIECAKTWHDAEEYHQDYLKKAGFRY